MYKFFRQIFVPSSATTIMHRCVALLCFLFIIQHIAFSQKEQYKIAYNVFEDKQKDNYDIYIMNIDGSQQRNITNTPGVEWVYHAFDDKIFFISDRDSCHRCYFLYEMNTEGKSIKKISNLQLEDSWMSTRNKGTEMIVLGRTGNQLRNQLFLINLTDGSYTQLTNDSISQKRDPLFLPGGNEIALAYRPNKMMRETMSDEIWKMNTDGSNKMQLTHFPKEDTTTAWYEYHTGPPQWNNKYQFISYLSRQNKQQQIYAVTPDGKNQWQITSGKLGAGWHSWSPDGKWMVMDMASADESNYDIYLMNFKTKKTIQLTSNAKYEQAPVFVKKKQ